MPGSLAELVSPDLVRETSLKQKNKVKMTEEDIQHRQPRAPAFISVCLHACAHMHNWFVPDLVLHLTMSLSQQHRMSISGTVHP